MTYTLFGGSNALLIKVLTLVIRFISLLFMLASPALLVPNAGSETVFDHPTVSLHISFLLYRGGEWRGGWWRGKGLEFVPRARKRSSERIAIAFTRRTETIDHD